MKKTSFKQSGLLIATALQEKKISKEVLTPRDRKLVIAYFLEEQSEETNTAIAELLGITPQAVGKIKDRLLSEAIWEIETIDIKKLAARLKKKANELQRKAQKAGDYGIAWRIETEFIEKLQDLGFVMKSPVPIRLDSDMTINVVYTKDTDPEVEEALRKELESYQDKGEKD